MTILPRNPYFPYCSIGRTHANWRCVSYPFDQNTFKMIKKQTLGENKKLILTNKDNDDEYDDVADDGEDDDDDDDDDEDVDGDNDDDDDDEDRQRWCLGDINQKVFLLLLFFLHF